MNKTKLALVAVCVSISLHAAAWAPVQGHIQTPWAETLNPSAPLPEYPRPQMTRTVWQNLNGLWNYAVSSETDAQMPSAEGEILVPFCIESSLSGVGHPFKPGEALWYSREFKVPSGWKRVILHFDAVDWSAEVWLNGKSVGVHTGGYTAFSFDITPYLVKGTQKLMVKVIDPTDKGKQPIGKQRLNPKGIYYTPVSGIWQTVWMEPVSTEAYIEDYKLRSDISSGTLFVKPAINGATDKDKVVLNVLDGKKVIASGEAAAGEEISAVIPNAKLWSPSNPNLYDIKLTLKRGNKTLDSVGAYAALRKISVKTDAAGWKRLALNDEILFQFGPLDQGWWPDGLYTPACDQAIIYDIQKTKDMGFNMIRKHIKVEPSRWYYWADKLGMLVWQDMPSMASDGEHIWGHNFPNYGMGTDQFVKPGDKNRFKSEYAAIIDQLDKFQCIVVWVPFNEAWAQFDTGKIVDFTRKKDPTRLINGASGGNWVKDEMGDILDSHNYPYPKFRLKDRELVNVIGEYGGIGCPLEGHLWVEGKKNWGYINESGKDKLGARYEKYAKDLERLSIQGCAAAVYTQTTDVEVETNGLITYDRKIVKFDEQRVRKANEGVINYASEIKLLPESSFTAEYDGKTTELHTIRGGSLVMQVSTLGGRVISLWAPDRYGHYADVVCGYASIGEYIDNKGERFLGANVGPIANRISKGTFVVDNQKYYISKNNGNNTLHSGFKGIDMLVWDVCEKTDSSLVMTVVHPDGLDGFPGPICIRTKYTLFHDNSFRVDYHVESGKKCPINLAHHSFFNLRGCGNGTIRDHILTINASKTTPVDEELIPTGEIVPVKGTPLDFTEPHAIGERIDDYSNVQIKYGNGYDHNFILDRKKDGIETAAFVYEPEFGRTLEVKTDQPALQFYSGYFFDGKVKDKYGNPIVQNSSIALETQTYPDAMNIDKFPIQYIKGRQAYNHICIYKFGTK